MGLSFGVSACAGSATSLPAPIRTVEEAHAAIAQCGADTKVIEGLWGDYRRQRPFHSQEVAASEPLEGGCRVLILSEPPPGLTVAALKEVHPALGDLVPRRHAIGVDGWTEDLVGVLPPMSADDLADLTSDVHFALFGTAYRARLASITAPPPWGGTLNVEVRPAEVYDWVFGADAVFSPVDGGPSQHAADLLAPTASGVYRSGTSGLVLWSLPKDGRFEAQRANVRMFGIESDLVLGAIADDDTVLVVGRERLVPEGVMPPLRFETVKVLATSPLHELQQSYERRQLFAGVMKNGKDWAPILLSPSLVDTEFGSVLNVADQLLKRWSSNGTVDYERFDYPNEPRPWAFNGPISKVLGASSLTFNWNTSASGGLVEVTGDRKIYWMNHSAALHVSYMPEDKVDPRTAAYEDKARLFFSRQSDPYLVRAVQYTALFQAFRQLGVTEVDYLADLEVRMHADEANAVLETAGTEAFQRLMGASDAELHLASERAAARAVVAEGEEELRQSIIEHVLPRVPVARRAQIARRLQDPESPEMNESISRYRSALADDFTRDEIALRSNLASTRDPEAPHLLAVALVHRPMVEHAASDPGKWRAVVASLSSPSARAKAVEIGAAAAFVARYGLDLRTSADWAKVAAYMSDVDAVERSYRAACERRPVTSRIRTPSVVWSNSKRLKAHGGHNVGSKVATIPQRIEPAQMARLELDGTGLSFGTSTIPARSRPVALGGLAERPTLQGFPATGERPLVPRDPGFGWRRVEGEPTLACGSSCVSLKLLNADRGPKLAGSAAELRPRFKVDAGGSSFRAGSVTDVAEMAQRQVAREVHAGRGKGALLDFQLLDRDISSDEAQGLTRSIQTRLARQRLGAEASYVVHHSDSPIALSDYALDNAVVSEPVRRGDTYTISVSVPPKPGLRQRLSMRFSRQGTAPPDAAARTKAAVGGTVRSPAEIARDLKAQLGNVDELLLLELAVDAQPDVVEREPSAPRSRHAGTPGHDL
jgi:hypothetical protein